MHPLYETADRLSHTAIGSAIEVHRLKGPGLIESIYERCLMREKINAVKQRLVRILADGLVRMILPGANHAGGSLGR